jgi:hypothetical protein
VRRPGAGVGASQKGILRLAVSVPQHPVKGTVPLISLFEPGLGRCLHADRVTTARARRAGLARFLTLSHLQKAPDPWGVACLTVFFSRVSGDSGGNTCEDED